MANQPDNLTHEEVEVATACWQKLVEASGVYCEAGWMPLKPEIQPETAVKLIATAIREAVAEATGLRNQTRCVERLQADNAALRDVLQDMEWCDASLPGTCRYCCGNRYNTPHRSGCRLKAALDGTAANALLERLQKQDVVLAAQLERIERMAEERHLMHGAVESAFWGCSRWPCKSAAKFLREQPKSFSCRARQSGTAGGNDPAECDWPYCGCDPAADRVFGAIQESGHYIPKSEADVLLERVRRLEKALREMLWWVGPAWRHGASMCRTHYEAAHYAEEALNHAE